MAAAEIRLGLRQRNAPGLIGVFYPDDMPEDWRADFLTSLTTAIWLAPTDPDLAEALASVETSPRPVTAFLAAPLSDWDEATREWLKEHQDLAVLAETEEPAQCAWRPDQPGEGCRIGLVPASDDPAQLRGWLESFAEQAPAGVGLLFIDGDPPSTATLERLQTLMEMMGW